jgi:predicted glutamine amidotransferase
MQMIKVFRTAAMLVIAGMAAVFFSCSSSPHVHYDLKVFKHEEGWGYEILRNNKPFIYQEYIPAIEGNKVFADSRSAKKTGKLVLSKLQHHQLPVVSVEELQQLGVIRE